MRSLKCGKKILTIILAILAIGFAGGIFFWIGKSLGEKKTSASKSEREKIQQQITSKEQELAQANQQLARENSSVKKQELEQKIQDLQQQITYLKSQSPQPVPLPPPIPPGPPPPNSDEEIQATFKWNGSVKFNYWLFSSGKPGDKDNKKVEIAKDHPFIKGKKLDRNSPSFSIKFSPKNASRKESENRFEFDKGNINLELSPLGNWPDDPNWKEPEPVQITEKKVKNVLGGRDGYVFSTHIGKGNSTKQFELFVISENHPAIKKLLAAGKMQKAGEVFAIRFQIVDTYEEGGRTYLFKANNQNLEIIAEN